MDVFLPKGTRDLLPEALRARHRVMATIRGVFERFGFDPLETPAFERIETLMGKYGEEGDRLIYRILERGEGGREGKADLALRYDLTVPLARVMAMHPELRLPFRRWQMQPVWRADRPQKGRFREFWQCDVDIVGTTSAVAEAECLAVVATALAELGLPKFTIRVNDRRILSDLAQLAGADSPARETSVLVAIDKLDKIGVDGVTKDLVSRGFPEDKVAALWRALDLGGVTDPESALAILEGSLGERGRAGVAALREVFPAAIALGVPPRQIVVDPTLARGLDYYTGPVFEAVVDEPKVGSIAGGGRYDNLIGMFAGKPLPAVGVSLGLERLITVLEELGLAAGASSAPQVLVGVWGPETRAFSLEVAAALRGAGIRTELFADDAKLKRQAAHADARGVAWFVVAGPGEAAERKLTLKDMKGGTSAVVTVAEAIARIHG